MSRAIRSCDELTAALRDRAVEIGATRRDIDSLAGVSDGYASTVLAPRPRRRLATGAFFTIAAALGLRVVLEDDPAAVEAVRPHCTRKRGFPANQFETAREG